MRSRVTGLRGLHIARSNPIFLRVIIYAIGDIHGRADLLARLLVDVSADAARRDGRKRVVYLGDYVDRGPDSAGVIDTLLQGPPPRIDEQVCLRGNHEELMWFANRRVDWAFNWLLNGGVATKRSYGDDRARLDRHLDWIESLPVTHREGNYLFVHAGIVPGRPLEQQKPRDMVWIRDRFLRDERDHGFIVVHGHTPVRGDPDVRPNRINLDTGAAYGGPLTCAVLDSTDPQKRSFLRVP